MKRSDVSEPKQSLQEFLRDLRTRQAERGHTPMTAAEIDNYIRAERANWGDDSELGITVTLV